MQEGKRSFRRKLEEEEKERLCVMDKRRIKVEGVLKMEIAVKNVRNVCRRRNHSDVERRIMEEHR